MFLTPMPLQGHLTHLIQEISVRTDGLQERDDVLLDRIFPLPKSVKLRCSV
jgi:hypothetical protein